MKHKLTCTGPSLLKGVRMERQWECSCGRTFFGYDATVKREHRAHVIEATESD